MKWMESITVRLDKPETKNQMIESLKEKVVSFKETNNNFELLKKINDFALDWKLYHYDEDVTSVKVQLLWDCPENRLEELELSGELLSMLDVYGCVDHSIWLDCQQ